MQCYLEVQMSEVWFRYLQSVLGNAYQADIGAGIVLILEHLCVELGSLIPEISENILSLNVFLESNGLNKI